MKKKGFTYVEVAIALSIFTLILLFVMRMNHTTSTVMNRQRESTKKFYIAQLYMEKYKSNHANQAFNLYENFEDYQVIVNMTINPTDSVFVKVGSNPGSNVVVPSKLITVTVKNILPGANSDTDITINNQLIIGN